MGITFGFSLIIIILMYSKSRNCKVRETQECITFCYNMALIKLLLAVSLKGIYLIKTVDLCSRQCVGVVEKPLNQE